MGAVAFHDVRVVQLLHYGHLLQLSHRHARKVLPRDVLDCDVPLLLLVKASIDLAVGASAEPAILIDGEVFIDLCVPL